MAGTTPLLILGTGTFAEEIADLASDIGAFNVSGFVENMEIERCQGKKLGLPVIWVDDLAPLLDEHLVVCGLATTERDRFVDQVARLGARFATLVHPIARMSRTSTLGEGSILSAGSIVASHAALGRHLVVNRGALIGHHTRIGDYVTVGPGVNIAGNCLLGDRITIGVGATIIDHVSIGRCSVIAAGALVTRDVPESVLVAGAPARALRRGIERK